MQVQTEVPMYVGRVAEVWAVFRRHRVANLAMCERELHLPKNQIIPRIHDLMECNPQRLLKLLDLTVDNIPSWEEICNNSAINTKPSNDANITINSNDTGLIAINELIEVNIVRRRFSEKRSARRKSIVVCLGEKPSFGGLCRKVSFILLCCNI